MGLRDVLKEADEVKPLAVIGGKPTYSFEDAQKLNKAILMDKKAGFKDVDLGERTVTDNGLGYTSSRQKNVAITQVHLLQHQLFALLL